MAYIAGVVKTPGGSACWNIMKVSYTPTIVDEIEGYLKEHPSPSGSMDEREDAALQAFVEIGTIDQEQVQTFIEVHDLLSSAGLMP